MSRKFKDISMNNSTYYFFDDIISAKNFELSKIKIDKELYKDILVYCIGYVTIKDSKYLKIKCKSFITYYAQGKWIV